MKRRSKRGYPLAVLVGFVETRAVLWQIFSKVVKHYSTVEFDVKDRKGLYRFHETVMDRLRPLLMEGVKSIIIAAPMKTNYARDFLNHVRKHHSWLFRENGAEGATFGELVGSAGQPHEVSDLMKTKEFCKLLFEITSRDADRIIHLLEKHLNNLDGSSVVLYSLEDIEKLVYGQWERSTLKPEYVMLTNRYLTDVQEKNRIHRLLQISKNKDIQTKIVDVKTKAGVRLSQLGGLVCLAKAE